MEIFVRMIFHYINLCQYTHEACPSMIKVPSTHPCMYMYAHIIDMMSLWKQDKPWNSDKLASWPVSAIAAV